MALAVGLVGPAHAEKLYSVWTLEPTTEIGSVTYQSGEPILVQRLLPYEAVRLKEPARIKKKKQLNANVILFKVYQADGQAAYCTLKDQSTGHTSKSLFIPVLDKRPCLVDEDGDGVFDKRFSVFDKYGSALTPSGNLSKAKDLYAPAAYEKVAPSEFPVFRGFSFYLKNPESQRKREIGIEYDNGRGYNGWMNRSPDSTPEMPTALNVRVSEVTIRNGLGTLNVQVDPTVFIVGTSGGTFYVSDLPAFVETAS
ncbi:hypothetical protein [uncultured Erythrobacter sp.]|uniref:hypothetical protein n=1 Tax=uncultured Erythrobacter sp. TaxID=263913 RepID=UPI00263798DB|nr:hypothetical protein [uncultured Erythrobacter sp.]